MANVTLAFVNDRTTEKNHDGLIKGLSPDHRHCPAWEHGLFWDSCGPRQAITCFHSPALATRTQGRGQWQRQIWVCCFVYDGLASLFLVCVSSQGRVPDHASQPCKVKRALGPILAVQVGKLRPIQGTGPVQSHRVRCSLDRPHVSKHLAHRPFAGIYSPKTQCSPCQKPQVPKQKFMEAQH